MKCSRFIFGVLVCCLASTTAIAQDTAGASSFETLKLPRFGGMEGNLDGTLRRLFEGVHMILVAADSAQNVDIQSETVDFVWDEDAEESTLISIEFDGNVILKTDSGEIRSSHAVIDFATEEAVFTGKPVVDMSGIRGAEVEFIRMNLSTGDILAGHGSVKEFQLKSVKDTPSKSDESEEK